MKTRTPQLDAFKELRHFPGLKITCGGKLEVVSLELSTHWSTYSHEELLTIVKEQLYEKLDHMDIYGNESLIVGNISVHIKKLQAPLQLLADLITYEVHLAIQWFHNRLFTYALVNDITMSDDKVKRVMAAMQDEITREALRTKMAEYRLDQLPFDRQRSLAARRRQLFNNWGIGQAEWEQNSFSLWRIPTEYLVPDDI